MPNILCRVNALKSFNYLNIGDNCIARRLGIIFTYFAYCRSIEMNQSTNILSIYLNCSISALAQSRFLIAMIYRYFQYVSITNSIIIFQYNFPTPPPTIVLRSKPGFLVRFTPFRVVKTVQFNIIVRYINRMITYISLKQPIYLARIFVIIVTRVKYNNNCIVDQI